MLKIKINDIETQVSNELTILEACKTMKIDIPNFCHDERLVPHAYCGICVVEVEGREELLPACATKVEDGMNILTNSRKVRKQRAKVLENIMCDHALECTTCIRTGNCKLQDYSNEYSYGIDKIRVQEESAKKKLLPIDDSNPLFTYDPNKCIKCKKCFRVCEELQSTHGIECELRGYKIERRDELIEKIGKPECVSCGNCVSVCPVGALTPKKGEFYNVKKVRTTCPYCGVGCQFDLKVKNNDIVGVEPANGDSNKGLLCVKGKFGYKFVNHPERLKTPLIKKDGKFEEATWEEAYEFIADKFNSIKENHGHEAFAGLTSARCTNEENFLFQKMVRTVMKNNNVDHCARL